jgi:hypothetical protein
MIVQDGIMPSNELSIEEHILRLQGNLQALVEIQSTRYFEPHIPVPKNPTPDLFMAREYMKYPEHHDRFIHMLRVSPLIFHTILNLIKDHAVFQNNSSNEQIPVRNQLAVLLYRMGRYGNGASVMDIARQAGISEGAVELCTSRCLDAIDLLHDMFVRTLSAEEKELEKQWIDNAVGFVGGWRDGWLMYDGTIVVLHKSPGSNGDAYYTRKCNYGLNLQVSD